MDGTTVGLTPLPYQYSGRHISYWKLLVSVVDRLAPGVTGKIQVGADPGDSAQVIVPATGVPLAAGTVPNAPVELVIPPPELALLQAARPMATATAHTAASIARREPRSGRTRDRAAVRRARAPGPSFRACTVCGRAIAATSVLGNLMRQIAPHDIR